MIICPPEYLASEAPFELADLLLSAHRLMRIDFRILKVQNEVSSVLVSLN